MIISVNCIYCNKEHIIIVNNSDYDDWKNHGKLIQDAFPYLNADQRELLISRICPTCWEEMFKEENK